MLMLQQIFISSKQNLIFWTRWLKQKCFWPVSWEGGEPGSNLSSDTDYPLWGSHCSISLFSIIQPLNVPWANLKNVIKYTTNKANNIQASLFFTMATQSNWQQYATSPLSGMHYLSLIKYAVLVFLQTVTCQGIWGNCAVWYRKQSRPTSSLNWLNIFEQKSRTFH